MKILQVIQRPQRRGAEIFAVQLSEELLARGHNVRLLSLFPGPGGLEFSGDWLQLDRPPGPRVADVRGFRSLAHVVRTWKPDLIQANAADTLKYSVLSKRIFRWSCPIVYRNANQMGAFMRGNWHRRFNQLLVGSVDSVISVSEASRLDFHENFQYPDGMSVSIPIGIIPGEIDEMSAEPLDVSLPARYLIQIGSWVPEKQPLKMLSLFSRLTERFPQLHLVFLGSGPLREDLLAERKRLGLEKRVLLLPNRENIFPVLRRARALVMPSKIEGLPGVILEALYSKVPVIAFGVGGIPEILETGKTGWCIAPEESEDFVSAIQEVLTLDQRSLNGIQEEAFRLVDADFTLRSIASRFVDEYRKIGDRVGSAEGQVG